MMNTLSKGNGGCGDGGGGHYDHQNGAKTTTISTLCHCGRTTKCSKMVTLPFIDCLSLHSTPSPIIAHYDANFWLSFSLFSPICFWLSHSASQLVSRSPILLAIGSKQCFLRPTTSTACYCLSTAATTTTTTVVASIVRRGRLSLLIVHLLN